MPSASSRLWKLSCAVEKVAHNSRRNKHLSVLSWAWSWFFLFLLHGLTGTIFVFISHVTYPLILINYHSHYSHSNPFLFYIYTPTLVSYHVSLWSRPHTPFLSIHLSLIIFGQRLQARNYLVFSFRSIRLFVILAVSGLFALSILLDYLRCLVV